MRLPRLSAAVAFVLAVSPAFATDASSASAAPRVTVALETASLAVGDPAVATLTLDLTAAEATREATFPDWSAGWGEAEVLSASPVEKSATPGGVQLVQKLRLTAFRPGKTALPPVAIRLAGDPELRAFTPPDLALEVRSVIPADDRELAPAPPAPPRPLAVPRSFWWALAIGGGLAIFAGVLAWRRRPSADPLAAPELSPLDELERALGLLAAEPPAGAFAHLSQALRRYLGRRLGFRALESTTTEVQRRLAARRFEPALVQRAVRLLRLADQIKFARRPAESAEATARIAESRELARAIESHLAPAVEVAPTTAAAGLPAAGGGGAA